MPLLCAATLRHSFALLRLSVHRRCPDLPCKPCRCLCSLCKCRRIHCLSTLCLCLSTLCRCRDSRFSQCCAVPLQLGADLCYAFASTFNSVPLRFKSLRLSALSCRCLIKNLILKPSLACVSPTTDTTQSTIVEPFKNRFSVIIIQENDLYIDGRPAGTVSLLAMAMRSPCAVCALNGR